jgi:hypothetical protein
MGRDDFAHYFYVPSVETAKLILIVVRLKGGERWAAARLAPGATLPALAPGANISYTTLSVLAPDASYIALFIYRLFTNTDH